VTSTPHGALPDWLWARRGSVPVVVYAPHGGLREREVRRSDSVNDINTAELSREIAERLDAHALVNHGRDRNDTDLNRISDLTRGEPVVLAELRRQLEAAAGDGAVPLLLLVHGWNVAAPWCDIGVGMTERGDELRGRHPTVSLRAMESVVRPLMRSLAGRDLIASIGHHYPASGRDNATQIFSGRYADHDHADVAHLAGLAAAGKVDAVQLELGISLRWLGPRREQFVDALAEVVRADLAGRCSLAGNAEAAAGVGQSTSAVSPVLSSAGAAQSQGTAVTGAAGAAQASGLAATSSRAEWSLPPRRVYKGGDRLGPGHTLQCVLDDGSGIFMGAEPTSPNTMAARFCVARTDGTLLLFVCEGTWEGGHDRFDVAGFEFAADGSGFEDRAGVATISYQGPLVRYPTHEAFVDLERGLCGSTLAEARVEMRFEALPGTGGFGRLVGSLDLDGVGARVDVAAACDRSSRRGPVSRSRTRVFVLDGPHAPRLFEAAVEDDEPEDTQIGFGAADGELHVRPGGDALPSLSGRTEIEVPVYRPQPDGSVVKVTFGVATLGTTGGDPSSRARGLFEKVEVFRPG